MLIIEIFLLIHYSYLSLAYIDSSRVKLAIDCGNQYYYKDKSKVLYRNDQFYQGGKINRLINEQDLKTNINQSNFILPTKYIDMGIYTNERAVPDTGSDYFFSYEIPILLPGTYNLIFCFIESEFHQQSQRRFDILIETYQFKQRYDIFKESGGFLIPVYENLEFNYRNDMIYFQDNNSLNMKESKQIIKIYLRGRGAKLDGIILYYGNASNILYDLNMVLYSNDIINQQFMSPQDFTNWMIKRGKDYAQMNEMNKGNYSSQQLVRQYLSPFQQLILNNNHQNIESYSLVMNKSNVEYDYIFSAIKFIQQQFFTYLSINQKQTNFDIIVYWLNYILVFVQINKLLFMALIINFGLLWHCLGTNRVNKIKIQEKEQEQIKQSEDLQKIKTK